MVPLRKSRHEQEGKTVISCPGGITAALYVALTLIFAPISFGPVQVRIAEALSILPMFTKAAVPGLFIGCLLGEVLGDFLLRHKRSLFKENNK